jgi:predicted acylesterase/phospholipase RssA
LGASCRKPFRFLTRPITHRANDYYGGGSIVRNVDALSVLNTQLPRDESGSPPRRRITLTIWLVWLICLLALQGCATLAVSESRSSNRQLPSNLQLSIRTLGTDERFSELPSTAVAERLRALHAGEPFNILALSGGGSAGAFGAGAVAGLFDSGTQPDFAVVTGVSAGALVAPYAFLGATWGPHLRDAFTGGAADHLLHSRGLGMVFGSSLYRGAPLKRLVDAYVSDTMIEAVARESDKGRLLLVATTDVATGEPIVWDLGSIARNGGPAARTLFRDVLVASASVPGMFPPVIIRVREDDGALHDEAHVDGAPTMPFFVPSAFLRTPPEVFDGTRRTGVYVIINGPLVESVRATRLTARAILSRTIHAGLDHMLLTTLELTASIAQLQGATLQYAAVSSVYPPLDPLDFRADAMRPLFRYADDCARDRRLWTPFRRTGAESRTVPRAETQEVPCPADDVFIRYFASR